MKQIFAFSLTLLAIQLNYAQEITTNDYRERISLNDLNLKGSVEKVTSTAYDNAGNTTTLPFLENEYYNQVSLTFNKKGTVVKRTNYLDYKGKLGIYNYIEFSYDNSNNLIEQKSTVINNNEDPLRVASLKEYQYNNAGNISTIKEIVKTKNSTINYATHFSYSNQLDEIKNEVSNTLSSKNILTYNKAGNLIKNESVSFDHKKGMTRYYIYDKNMPIYAEEVVDNAKQITYYDIESGTSKIQHYDQKQNLKLELVFNNQRNVTAAKVQSFQNGKSILKEYQLTYKLDAVGNWIRCDVTNNGDTKYTIKREIIYY